ncbi:MAG TPA: hypothetical protein VF399_09625 [bacterium]
MIRFCLFILMAALAALHAVTPLFDAPIAIQAGGSPINVGYGGNASPFMIDWDSDGKQDLLLGQFDAGKIRFYANTGTNYNPAFGSFSYLQADGVDISLSCG